MILLALGVIVGFALGIVGLALVLYLADRRERQSISTSASRASRGVQ